MSVTVMTIPFIYIETAYLFSSLNSGKIVKSMVKKQALPPTRFEIGSAQNTPSTPSPLTFGNNIVKGTTMITFRKIEKNVALFAFPSATNTACPVNCNAIKQNPKK